MSSTDEIRILAPRETVNRLTRRGLLGGAALAALGGGTLAACGSSSTTAAVSTADATYGTGTPESALNIYTWGEYDSPDVLKEFTSETGPTITTDTFNSNEDMIAKLVAANGTAGYDIVVPTGIYIPQMAEQGLLMPLNLDAIPNFSNLDTAFTNQTWDQGNVYSVPKDWGTTGYVYDNTVITRELTSWADFYDAAQNEASGRTTILDDPQEAFYFWAFANGKDPNTAETADMEAAEAYLTALAPHIKSFVSYVSSDMAAGKYALMHAWNGDARQGILNTTDDPDRWTWVLPSEGSPLWMDNWCIPTGAKNLNAAHAFIDYVLQPEVSLAEVEYIGYHTAVKDIETAAQDGGFELLDMVFFTDEQKAKFTSGEINDSLQTRVDILNKVKAAASA